MKQMVMLMLLGAVVVVFAGCEQESSTANKSQQDQEKAVGHVAKLAEIYQEAPQDIQDAVNKENEKLEEAKKIIEEDETQTEEKTSNNSQKQSTMTNIPEQINMDFAQTCKSATLKTNKGDITIAFDNNNAPVAVANFCTIADKGDYDNVIFHRVIQDFMIQSGDPEGTGMGGPGYKFDDEIHENNSNDVGTIALANVGPGTNGSQFFINTKANNFLDTKHTVFGRVIEGMETVTAIEGVKVGANDKPVEDVIIESIELEMN